MLLRRLDRGENFSQRDARGIGNEFLCPVRMKRSRRRPLPFRINVDSREIRLGEEGVPATDRGAFLLVLGPDFALDTDDRCWVLKASNQTTVFGAWSRWLEDAWVEYEALDVEAD